MKQIVHVAQQAIRSKSGPPIIVRDHKGSARFHEIELVDAETNKVLGRFVYRPDKPLSCGARLWLELDTKSCFARGVENESS